LTLIATALGIQVLMILNSTIFGKFQGLFLIYLVLFSIVLRTRENRSMVNTSKKVPEMFVYFGLILPLLLTTFNFYKSSFPNTFQTFIKGDFYTTQLKITPVVSESKTNWISSTLGVDKIEADSIVKTYLKLPVNSKYIFPRPVSLYLLDKGKNPTRNFMFARYFDETSAPLQVIEELQKKHISYIFVEPFLAATASAKIYTFILENYTKIEDFGTYELWERGESQSEHIRISRIVSGFSPKTNAPEYVYANYLKINPIEGEFRDSLYTSPPFARCVVWKKKEALKNYEMIRIRATANPLGAQSGEVSIQYLHGLDLVSVFKGALSVGEISTSSSLSKVSVVELCSTAANGTYWDVDLFKTLKSSVDLD
jgi:hypothetical protein